MDNLELARSLFYEGTTLFGSGRYAEAEAKLRHCLELVPDRVSTLVSLSGALLKQDKCAEARSLCERIIALSPNSSEAYFNLGLISRIERRFDESIRHFDKAISFEPNFPDSWFYRGMSLFHAGQHLEAFKSFEKCLALQPKSGETFRGISQCFYDARLFNISLAFAERFLALEPGSAEGHYEMALLLRELGRDEEAIAALRRSLEFNHPNPELVNFSLAALEGKPFSGETPTTYVSELFDSYAEKFDEHLQGSLRYSTPKILFSKISSKLVRKGIVLDIGCGTGLMGQHLRPISAKLIGVDLSKKMVDRARSRNLYDELHVSDLNGFLDGTGSKYDLIVAADVLNYLGDLTRTFRNIFGALEQSGGFAFTVEASGEEGFQLQRNMRYSHSDRYCIDLATSCGFSVQLCERDFMRIENGAEVSGSYLFLTKP